MNETPNEEIEIQGKKKESRGSFFRVLIVTFLIALSIRVFIAQPFVVSGQSMEPTFSSGEYLIIDEVSYRFNEPERGDVIVFRFPDNTTKFFIKRIIALPEETININQNGVFITTKDGDEFRLVEDYLESQTRDNQKVTLAIDEYFVMGDNRSVSSDSRRWGPVSENLIVGRAIFRFLPVTKAEILPGHVEP